MKRKAALQYTICIVVLIGLSVFLAGCGSDEAAPSIDTSFIPQTVFFNDTGSDEFYLFTGRATDNTNVDTVLVSGDNGATWGTADIDNDPPNKDWDVEWSFLASSLNLSAGIHTVLVRASDRDGNVTTSAPIILESHLGSTISSLLDVFIAASTGDVIGLSTGEGFAYGDSATPLTIPIDVNLTVLGSGYGNTVTSGSPSFPAAASTATIIQSSVSSASIFSVNADLTIKKMRLLGAENAVRIWDSAGPDPQLSVEDCVFDMQGAWAVYAEDDNGNVNVEFLSSIVDASRADSPSGGGGLYLDNVNYTITDSLFYRKSPAGPGAGVLAVGGAGLIDNSIFSENALAIWASGGSPVITSCNISGAAFTTYGINLTGGPGEVQISRNTIDGHIGGYGLRVGGEMELTLRNNAITNNGLSGVLIDSTLSNTNLTKINMGESTDQGRNLFDGNSHPNGEGGWDTQVYVTLATQEGSTWIPANWNYWGEMVSTSLDVNRVIIDGNDNAARATLAIGGIHFGTSEVGP